jgi:hypothetical protein
MQYSKMIDLIDQAKNRGEDEQQANEVLRDSFESWLYEQPFRDKLNDEEEQALWEAFQEGFGIKC